MNLRILKSSTSRSLNSCLEAYQRLRQSSMIPTRKPVGRTFWPMAAASSQGRVVRSGRPVASLAAGVSASTGVQVGQADADVRRSAADHVGHAPGPGHQPLEHRAAVAAGVEDDQVADVADPAVLGVGHGALEHLLDHPGAAVRHVLEDVDRVVGVLAADQVEDRQELAHRDPGEAVRGRDSVMAGSWPWSPWRVSGRRARRQVSRPLGRRSATRLGRRPSLALARRLAPCRRGRGRSGSGRTRRACGRPCPRSRTA